MKTLIRYGVLAILGGITGLVLRPFIGNWVYLVCVMEGILMGLLS